jgi:hypothetical protein
VTQLIWLAACEIKVAKVVDMNTPSPAIQYLATAYEEMGHKVVAMALRQHGANAAKFKIELSAVEAAIRGTREEDAAIAERLDQSGEIAMVIRSAANIRNTQEV